MNSARTFSRRKVKPLRGLSGIAITGILPSKIISSFISLFNEKTGANVRVLPIKNRLFGKTVTVSGLLSGDDIVRAVAGKKGEMLFIPKVMLRETGDRFLDDLTPEGLGEMTGKRVVIFEPDPLDYYRKCLEIVYN
jgi:NifB/MoaA-like Fe-S oxidoreductase